MAQHPTDDELFNGDRAALEHARGCEDCRVRSVRLRAGQALVQRVRKTSQPDMDWAKVDAFIAQAAESTAQDIRAGRIARPSASRRPAVIGASLAIAAASVLAWRLTAPSSPAVNGQIAGSSVAQTNVVAPRSNAGGEAPLPAVAAWREARVLLAAGEVTHVPAANAGAAGEPSPLTARSRVRAGDRIRGSALGSRAMLATAAGQRLDARGVGEVRLASLDAAGSQVELVSGEARVDVAPSSGKLSLTVQGWSVVAKRGAFVAKIDGDTVRVRVLSGVVDVAHEGGEATPVEPGREVVLDKRGGRQMQPEAAVANEPELDPRTLGVGEEGELVDVPEGREGAELQIDGAPLPSRTRVLRLSRAVRVIARQSDGEWAIELDPRRAAAQSPQWSVTRPPAVASNTVASRGTDAGASTVLVAQRSGLPPRRPPVVARTVLTAATIPPAAAMGYRAVQRALGQRSRHCFDACERSNACGESAGIAPIVDFDAEGRVGAVRLDGSPAPALAACIEREVRAMRLPLLAGERVNLGRFSR
jgi:hypothetical protein